LSVFSEKNNAEQGLIKNLNSSVASQACLHILRFSLYIAITSSR